MTARFGDNALPDTGIEADLRQTAHSKFARQPCNKPIWLALRRSEFCSYPACQ
jgi:hypothetical protein